MSSKKVDRLFKEGFDLITKNEFRNAYIDSVDLNLNSHENFYNFIFCKTPSFSNE